MSPENKVGYERMVVNKKETLAQVAVKKAQNYPQTRSWGVPINQRLSYTGNFRK